jgi:hypothetical protein
MGTVSRGEPRKPRRYLQAAAAEAAAAAIVSVTVLSCKRIHPTAPGIHWTTSAAVME